MSLKRGKSGANHSATPSTTTNLIPRTKPGQPRKGNRYTPHTGAKQLTKALRRSRGAEVE